MKIDFERKLHTLAGKEITNTDKSEVTLKSISVEALLGIYPDEQALTGMEKFGRYHLAQRIHGGEADFTAEEIGKIKLVIGKAYPPAVVGPAYIILDGLPSSQAVEA